MPARREMIAECAGIDRVSRAVAIDSMTIFATRCIGPIVGGFVYGSLGIWASFLLSAVLNSCSARLARKLHHSQEFRGLSLPRMFSGLREGLVFARDACIVGALLSLTVVTNLFGYSYNAVAPSRPRSVRSASYQDRDNFFGRARWFFHGRGGHRAHPPAGATYSLAFRGFACLVRIAACCRPCHSRADIRLSHVDRILLGRHRKCCIQHLSNHHRRRIDCCID